MEEAQYQVRSINGFKLTEFEAPSFRIRERLVDVFLGLLVASATATATGGRHRQREGEAGAAHRGGLAARSTARQLVLSFSLPSCCPLAGVEMGPSPTGVLRNGPAPDSILVDGAAAGGGVGLKGGVKLGACDLPTVTFRPSFFTGPPRRI